VFYSIGLTAFVSDLWKKVVVGKSGQVPWYVPDDHFFTSQWNCSCRSRLLDWLTFAVIAMIGLSPTVLESVIPRQFTVEKMHQEMEGVGIDLNVEESRPSYLYGKMLYPRFFEAYQQPLDDRKGTLPAASISRIDFYLIGTRNIWVSFPVDQPVDDFSHGAEVLVEGSISRDTNYDLMYGGKKPYFIAQRIYFIE
jgi:hypothetical protein